MAMTLPGGLPNRASPLRGYLQSKQSFSLLLVESSQLDRVLLWCSFPISCLCVRCPLPRF